MEEQVGAVVGEGSPAGEVRSPGAGEAGAWRERAVLAEERARTLLDRVQRLDAELREARESMDASERRRAIDAALHEGDPVDLETARMLVESAMGSDATLDPSRAVAELRSRKAYLFRRGVAPGARAAAPAAPRARHASIGALAETARESGDRGDLLRYLRERRLST